MKKMKLQQIKTCSFKLSKTKSVLDEEVAIWLSNEKKNLDFITLNNNEVNLCFFKVAPTTGWDCPKFLF